MIEELLDRIARLEHRISTMNPVGKVIERDHAKGVRIQLGGTDDEPLKSPWIQPGDWAGTTRYLPDIGEQCMVMSHGGDWRQATLMPLTHTDDKKNPSASADEQTVFNKGKFKLAYNTKDGTVTLTNDKSSTVWKAGEILHTVDGVTHSHTKDGIVRKVSGVTETLSQAGLDTTGGKLSHNQRDVGSDHVHSGVKAGSDKSAGPDA